MMELEALQASLPRMKELGATLVAISPQLPQYGRLAKRRTKAEFDILSDVHLKVAEQFGLVFTLADFLQPIYKQLGATLDVFNGEAAYRLPMPARYVLDRGGIIVSADVSPDYTVRPEPEETLRVLEHLK